MMLWFQAGNLFLHINFLVGMFDIMWVKLIQISVIYWLGILVALIIITVVTSLLSLLLMVYQYIGIINATLILMSSS